MPPTKPIAHRVFLCFCTYLLHCVFHEFQADVWRSLPNRQRGRVASRGDRRCPDVAAGEHTNTSKQGEMTQYSLCASQSNTTGGVGSVIVAVRKSGRKGKRFHGRREYRGFFAQVRDIVALVRVGVKSRYSKLGIVQETVRTKYSSRSHCRCADISTARLVPVYLNISRAHVCITTQRQHLKYGTSHSDEGRHIGSTTTTFVYLLRFVEREMQIFFFKPDGVPAPRINFIFFTMLQYMPTAIACGKRSLTVAHDVPQRTFLSEYL